MPTSASFDWSFDSQRVDVEADRNDDGKNEVSTFFIRHSALPSAGQNNVRIPLKPRLSKSAMRVLKKRFQHIDDVAFSPDRKWVAAQCANGRQDSNYRGGIFIFRADGSAIMQVTRNGPFQLISPSRGYVKDDLDKETTWLPNGEQIVLRRGSCEEEY